MSKDQTIKNYKKMKKLVIMIFALLFAGMGIVKAQQPQQKKMQMRNYFHQTILPFVEQQQAKFEQALTASEKETLENIRKEMTAFHKQGAQIRKNMQGNFNKKVWQNRKTQFDAIVAKARKLADIHPKEAEAYKKAVENEMAKWKEHMPAMAQERMGKQNHEMMRKSRQTRMQKMSDPALGLLMDRSQMNRMMMHQPHGMKGKQGMMKTMHNPEIKAKVKAYAEKNIFPVISKEREAFDKVLSKKEKKVIANARLQMQAQKAKMRQMRINGKMTMNDSTKLAMWQQMDKNRVALRQIVLNHYGELQKQLASIKEKMPQWRADIHNIIMPNMPRQQFKPKGMSRMSAKSFQKNRKDIMFLLFDPQHPNSNMFMHTRHGNGKR